MDYYEGLDYLIRCGNFKWVDGKVNESNFPSVLKSRNDIWVFLVKFKHSMRTREVIEEFGEHYLRPLNPDELVAFAIKSPEKYWHNTTIALGRNWVGPDDQKHYVAIDSYMGRMLRCLCDYQEGGWSDTIHFAATHG